MASVSQNFYDQQSYAQKVRAQIKPGKIKAQVGIWFKLIDKAAPYALVMFFVGMIALYAQMDFQTVQAGGDIILDDDVLFGEPDPTVAMHDNRASSLLNILIGLGLGGLILVNVSVMHRLISHVRDRLPPLLEKRSQLKAITVSSKKIVDGTKVMVETARDIERRKSITAEDHALETYADIEAAVAPTMRKLSVLSRIYKSIRPGGVHTLDKVDDVQLTRRSNPSTKVARNVGRLIMRPASSSKARQQKTEIVAMLQWNQFNCAAGDHIIVLTDAIETGAVRSPLALLNGKASLPTPKAGSMRLCSVSFWGIGRLSSGGITSAQVNNLTKVWVRYFRIAGAKFYPVPNP